jgi:hypothetical protein
MRTEDETIEIPQVNMILNAQPVQEEEYPIFVPDNFEEYSEEQLQMLIEKVQKAEESAKLLSGFNQSKTKRETK